MMREDMYDAYLVRIWQGDTRRPWRAQIVPVGAPGSEGRFFNDPAQLSLYWFGETGAADTQPLILQGDES
jgi:hypothetical protein